MNQLEIKNENFKSDLIIKNRKCPEFDKFTCLFYILGYYERKGKLYKKSLNKDTFKER